MQTIVIENVFPKDTPRANLDAEVKQRLMLGALSCFIEERGDIFVIVTIQPGPDMILAAASAGVDPSDLMDEAAKVGSIATLPGAKKSAKLGSLSEKFESSGKPGAVGEDSTGGPSYGLYQIATKTGTMASFLKFLERTNPVFASKLTMAGGRDGALQKSASFVSTWQVLANDPAFSDAQHAFIKSTHYDPFIERVKKKLKLNINTRKLAVRNAAWSTAVQHGPANRIFEIALKTPANAKAMDDKGIINAVYDERSKVNIHFKSSTTSVKKSVKDRFKMEKADALAMLA